MNNLWVLNLLFKIIFYCPNSEYQVFADAPCIYDGVGGAKIKQ